MAELSPRHKAWSCFIPPLRKRYSDHLHIKAWHSSPRLFLFYTENIKVMRLFCIVSICILSCVSSYSQTLSTAKEVSIQIEEDDFYESSAINFFIGELSQYFQSQGVNCKINQSLSHRYNCQNELYVFVALRYNQYLASNGCWSWHYSNISFGLVNGCGNKREIFIDDIKVPNLRGHLVDKFRKKLKNK